MFVARRAAATLTYISWAITNAHLSYNATPLYHIAGELNVADYLTKIVDFDVNQVGRGSVWNEGLPWMKLPTDQLIASLNSFEKVKITPSNMPEFEKDWIDTPYFPHVHGLSESPAARTHHALLATGSVDRRPANSSHEPSSPQTNTVEKQLGSLPKPFSHCPID